MSNRIVLTRKVLCTLRVSKKANTSYYRPRSVFRVFGKRSASKFSKLGDFLRSYLSRHDHLPAWFLTLTLHYQMQGDRECNKILSSFLNHMRKKKIIKSYFWRAEVQKRGAIHWHVVFISCSDYDKKTLSSLLWALWQKANTGTSGYPADFVKLDILSSGGAAYYTSKYVAKLAISSRPLTSRTCGISSDFQRIVKPVISYEAPYSDFNATSVSRFPNSSVSVSFDNNNLSNVVFSQHCDFFLYADCDHFAYRLIFQPYLSGRIGLEQLRRNLHTFSGLAETLNFFVLFFRFYLDLSQTLL